MNIKGFLSQHIQQAIQKLQVPKVETRETSKQANDTPPLPTPIQDVFERLKTQPLDLTGGVRAAVAVAVAVAKAAAQGTEGGRTITNPALHQFMQENPEIQTVEQFIQHCMAQENPYRYLANKCQELGLDQNELLATRTANLSEWAWSGPELAPNLPSTEAQANELFITQFTDATFNPDAESSTTNCGPTSLAMALSAAGKMPEGLTPEQQIDYARAKMYPDNPNIEHITVNGQEIPQLNQDDTFTDISAITQAAGSLEAGGLQNTGWAALDDALASGQTVVCPGNVGTEWSGNFPDPDAYHLEGDGHFIAVLGRTEDGKYLVADPLYPGGTVAMTRAQLDTFFQLNTQNDPIFAAIG